MLAVAVLVLLARAARAERVAGDLAPGGGVLGVEGRSRPPGLQRRPPVGGPSRRDAGPGAGGDRRLGYRQLVFAAEGIDVVGLHRRQLDRLEQRSEEHTSELQSLRHLVCRLLLEKKNK